MYIAISIVVVFVFASVSVASPMKIPFLGCSLRTAVAPSAMARLRAFPACRLPSIAHRNGPPFTIPPFTLDPIETVTSASEMRHSRCGVLFPINKKLGQRRGSHALQSFSINHSSMVLHHNNGPMASPNIGECRARRYQISNGRILKLRIGKVNGGFGHAQGTTRGMGWG